VTSAATLQVESHSIDFVPTTERYGTPLRLFTIWFSINLSIVCAAVGALGPASGLSLGWSVIGIAVGNALGTLIMAGHSAQGPHLGVPQMIQSRAQFGVLGAAVPLIAVVMTYTLYTAADGLLVEGPIDTLLHCGNSVALILFGVLTIAIAYVGYELIHRLGVVLAFTSAALFIAAFWLYVRGGAGALPMAPPVEHPFRAPLFMLMVTQAAAWSLSFGPYVADYSRYLPATVRASTTFWATALGCFAGTTLVMAFGAYLSDRATALGADPGGAVAAVFGPLKPVALALVVLSVLQGNVMNLYSAYMSSVTIFSAIQRMNRIGQMTKLWVMTLLMAAATLIALWAQDNFQTYFADILSVMIYLLVPWSAINLVDYYVVRKGHYVIADFFRLDGQYSAVRVDTLAIYLVGILAQVPFMNLSFFAGSIAQRLGADLAWAPGLVIPAVIFAWRERGRV